MNAVEMNNMNAVGVDLATYIRRLHAGLHKSTGSCGVWRTRDGGATWRLVRQMYWPSHVLVDPVTPSRVYATGAWNIDVWGNAGAKPGEWGYGGQLYSDDGGTTWAMNDAVPGQSVQRAVWPHPTDRCSLLYATSGLGLMQGPAPNAAALSGCT